MGGSHTSFSPFHGKEQQQQAERGERTIGQEATTTAQDLSNLANQLFKQTDPLRSSTISTLQSVLTGQRPSTLGPFAPALDTVNQQYDQARQNILAGGARGGQLNQLLADTDRARAATISGLDADVRTQAFNQALGTGFGSVPQVFGGLTGAGSVYGTAANTFSNLANRQAAGKSSSKGGASGSLGAVAGLVGALAAA